MQERRSSPTRIAVAAVTVVGLLLASGSAVSARSSQIPVISIEVTNAGFTMPAQVQSGLVTFTVSSPDPTYHAIQGFRTKPGATVDMVVDDLRKGLNADRFVAAEGHRLLLQHAVLVGGVVTTEISPISVTISLEPGTYHFFDLNDIFAGITPRVHTLEAVGQYHWAGLPQFDAVILATMVGDQPRIIAPDHLPASGSFLVVVAGHELHEVVLRPVAPGTTDEQISEFYTAVINGTPRPPNPVIGRQFGLQALSPHRMAILTIDVPIADWALFCIVPSAESGYAHSWLGMHQVVQWH
jgi:hypothetical protein